MTESEAIKIIKEKACNNRCIPQLCNDGYMYENTKCAFSMAIKALEDVQQYRALEKHLSDMFGGSLSLKMCVDELERILVEPDSPHPMNAKILTYQEAADWEAYRAIGTPEECRAAMEKQTAVSRELIEGKYFCPKCHNLMRYPGYCGCGQRLY